MKVFIPPASEILFLSVRLSRHLMDDLSNGSMLTRLSTPMHPLAAVTLKLASVLKEKHIFFEAVRKWLSITASSSSSSAPPRPAPAGPSGPLGKTAGLAKTIEDLSKSVASLAKCKDSSNGGGADTKRSRKDKGKGKGSKEQLQQEESSRPVGACCAPDCNFISTKFCFECQNNACSDRICAQVRSLSGYHTRFRLMLLCPIPVGACSPHLHGVNELALLISTASTNQRS